MSDRISKRLCDHLIRQLKFIHDKTIHCSQCGDTCDVPGRVLYLLDVLEYQREEPSADDNTRSVG